MYKIGIDTGGTNTDLVLTNIENGKIYSTKTATTTDNLIEGIFTTGRTIWWKPWEKWKMDY